MTNPVELSTVATDAATAAALAAAPTTAPTTAPATASATAPMADSSASTSLILAQQIDTARRLWNCPDATDLEFLHQRLAALQRHEATVADFLIVVLVGGTKVGKTTMINALAGQTVGETSARACHTSRPAVYLHRRREHVARLRLSGVLAADDQFILHDVAALERLVLIDTPDLDGIDIRHRQVFSHVLEQGDLALCVVTTQKYDSLALFRVLGDEVGFRRTVFVFNRIDEGIPLSEKISCDLLHKVAPLGLRPPEGERIPVFAVSARNAFLAKTNQPVGPIGQFKDLELFLRDRLDETVTRRISAENLSARSADNIALVLDLCRCRQARQLAESLMDGARRIVEETISRLSQAVAESLHQFAPELGRQRIAAAANSLGGPFGAYIRVSLALSGLAGNFSWWWQQSGADLGEAVTQRFLQTTTPYVTEAQQRFRRLVVEQSDRLQVGADPLLADLDRDHESAVVIGDHLAQKIRQFVIAPLTGRLESMLLNLLPVTIIVLVLRYFFLALWHTCEPGAGMFLGSALVFWLVCHLQSLFWCQRKTGSLDSFLEEGKTALQAHLHKKILAPTLLWSDQVHSGTELLDKDKTGTAENSCEQPSPAQSSPTEPSPAQRSREQPSMTEKNG